MGIYTWAAFGGTNDAAAVDGDFAATDAELQPVLKALRGGGILDRRARHAHAFERLLRTEARPASQLSAGVAGAAKTDVASGGVR